MKSDLIDIVCHLHHETHKAILVSDTGENDDAVWLPKSQCEFVHEPNKPHLVTVTTPEWLAQSKGLI